MSCSNDNALKIELNVLDEKFKFGGTARSNPEVVIDYFPPVGTGEGYTSLEMLMLSFGSCISTTVGSILRYRMKKTITGIRVTVCGVVKEEHPKCLSEINAVIEFTSNDLTEYDVETALSDAEDKFCPVWAMIKGNAKIDVQCKIIS